MNATVRVLPANSTPAPAPRADSRYDAVVLAAAGGHSAAAIARSIGVHERTVRRYQARPDYRHRVEDVRTALFEAAAGRLLDSVDRAVDTLLAVLTEGDTSAARVSAARTLITQATALRAETVIEARLREVEARLGIGDPS